VIVAELSEEEQQRRREWFRRHWEEGVAFNRHMGLRVQRWDVDAVECVLPYAGEFSAHEGVFHGGVVSALIDTCGCGAILAGHDFTRGSRIVTLSMAVQYLGVAPGEDAVATGHCTRRGRLVHHADVVVRGVSSGRLMAQGLVTASIDGERPGLVEG